MKMHNPPHPGEVLRELCIASDFKTALFILGKKIAEASGGLLGFGSKISQEEKTALAAIALCLGINP